MAVTFAVIGGTGLDQLPDLKITERRTIETPYGKPSSPIHIGELHGRSLAFLARHGDDHRIPPHKVNYRANLWALQHIGVKYVMAVAAVGGITAEMKPARLVFPDQIIDYTWGREHTYADGNADHVQHVDFSHPYTPALREKFITAARTLKLDAVESGVYGATQGPRLESIAEIRRMARDGCDLVGMTGMPEAGLARELGLNYACCAVVVNWAAGLGTGDIHAEIEACIEQGMAGLRRLLEKLVPELAV
ncbi:MAG: S-methyl-5'-thioinosine phosphorylase [Nevskiales bacterium]